MSTWARLDASQRVIEIATTDPTGRYHASVVWQSVPDGTQPGWIEANGVFAAPAPLVTPAMQAAEAAAALIAQAKAALGVTDMVAMRCAKAGVPFTADWQAYTVALRPFAAGTATGALPTKPAQYPAGSA